MLPKIHQGKMPTDMQRWFFLPRVSAILSGEHDLVMKYVMNDEICLLTMLPMRFSCNL